MNYTEALTVLDSIYLDVLDQVIAENRWLFWQTILTKEHRRSLVDAIAVSPNDRVLDVGCGFGALAFDIAIMKNARVVGLDISDSSVKLASMMNDKLVNIAPVIPVQFIAGDIYDMPFCANSFNFVVARFLFQHLSAPERALTEILRTLKPGGHVCLIDIDDQLEIKYPDLDGDARCLYKIFREVQKLDGGDRMVGRKLASYVYNCGCEIVATILRPETEIRYLVYDDPAIQFETERLCSAKNRLIDKGLITDEKFDEIMRKLRDSYPRTEWRTTSEVVVLGRKNSSI